MKIVELGMTGNNNSGGDTPATVVLELLDVILVVVVKTGTAISSLDELMGVVAINNGVLTT